MAHNLLPVPQPKDRVLDSSENLPDGGFLSPVDKMARAQVRGDWPYR
jgi:hypothetical protein